MFSRFGIWEIVLILVIILIIFGQRAIVSGLTRGAVK